MKSKEAKAVRGYYSHLLKNDIDAFCKGFGVLEILARDGVEYEMFNRIFSNLKCIKRDRSDTYEGILQTALKADGQAMKEKDRDFIKNYLNKARKGFTYSYHYNLAWIFHNAAAVQGKSVVDKVCAALEIIKRNSPEHFEQFMDACREEEKETSNMIPFPNTAKIKSNRSKEIKGNNVVCMKARRCVDNGSV